MSSITVRTKIEAWPLQKPFRITGHTFNVAELIVITLEMNGYMGRAEAAGLYYKAETPASMADQIEDMRPHIEAGISRERLRELLPPCGARNALDCALWDLEAKMTRKSIWELTGITPKPLTTIYTIGIDTPAVMMTVAKAAAPFRILKIKVDTDSPVERLAAIRSARPDAELVVDANQAWTFAQLKEFAPRLAEMRVGYIEQPLPRGEDEVLEGYPSPVPLCGDESCQHLGELDEAAKRYQLINIKLDKAGGLTEALTLARAIRGKGLQPLQGGRSVGTSLSMAPAFVVAQLCRYAELDTQLMLERDRSPSLLCENGQVAVPAPELWG